MALNIDKEIREFLEDHMDDIDAEQWFRLLAEAAELFTDRGFEQLVKVLDSCGADTTKARESLFVDKLSDCISAYRTYPDPQDTSNAWSRLQYMLMETNHYGFNYDEIVEICKRAEEKLDMHLSELPIWACYEMKGDLNLGWLNLAEYKRLYDNGEFN